MINTIKIDDWLANQKCLLNCFKNVHPNYITIFGIACNFILLNLLYHCDNILVFSSVLCLRYLSDIFDGSVARYFNKGSVLGGYLDSLCDIMLISIFLVYYTSLITTDIVILMYVCYSTILIFFIYFYMKKSLYDHAGLKVNPHNIIESCIQWFVNNTLFVYILQIILLYYIKL